MNQISAIRKFASIVAGEPVIIPRQRDCWSMCMADSKPRLILPPDPNVKDEGDKEFRKFFISLYPPARGFADVTLSILHEIGHHFHREEYIFCDFDEYERAQGVDHFKLHCEIVATEWAIEWLKDSQNRKVAKAFEKEYFGY